LTENTSKSQVDALGEAIRTQRKLAKVGAWGASAPGTSA
jgi:hypothetical protein